MSSVGRPFCATHLDTVPVTFQSLSGATKLGPVGLAQENSTAANAMQMSTASLCHIVICSSFLIARLCRRHAGRQTAGLDERDWRSVAAACSRAKGERQVDGAEGKAARFARPKVSRTLCIPGGTGVNAQRAFGAPFRPWVMRWLDSLYLPETTYPPITFSNGTKTMLIQYFFC